MDRDPARARLLGTLWAQPHLALLQRLTIMFPLLGVVITAGSLVLFPLAPTDPVAVGAGPTSALRVELFFGVLFGAALALINQLFVLRTVSALHAAMARADELFPDWVQHAPAVKIDEVVARLAAAVTDYERRVQKLLQTFDSIAASTDAKLGGAADRLESASHRVDVATVSLGSASEQLRDGLESFVKDLAASSQLVRTSLESVGERLSGCLASFSESLAAFREMPRDFTKATGELRTSITAIGDEAHLLQQAFGQMTGALSAINASGIEKLAPALGKAAEGIAEASGGWSAAADKLGSAAATLGLLSNPPPSTIAELTQTTALAVQELSATIQPQGAQLNAIAMKTDRLLNELGSKTERLEKGLGIVRRDIQRLGSDAAAEAGTSDGILKRMWPFGRTNPTKE